MTVEALAAWVFSLLVWQLPPERAANVPTYPSAQESVEQRTERYWAIAEDIAAVAHDSGRSDTARRSAAAYLLGVGILESSFARDVDGLACDPARVAKGGCDSGNAHSAWQIRGHAIESRRHAAKLALSMMRRSRESCRHLPEDERLSVYTSGSCSSAAGRRSSRVRVALVRKLEAKKELLP